MTDLQIIKEYEAIPLSDSQLLKLVDNKANLVLYPNIYRYQSVDDMLSPYGATILLFESKPNYGHWCLLFWAPGKDLEFFNPYGGYPDDSLDYISKEFKQASHQDKPYLSLLLLNSGYKLSYNEYQFQQDGPNIQTCGRHVACRLNNRHLSLKEYKKMLDDCRVDIYQKYQKKIDYDGVVTILTS